MAAALMLMSIGCSKVSLDEFPETNGNGSTQVETTEEGRRLVDILIQNNLHVKKENSRAAVEAPIATNAENEITAMDIYVFGSLTENGEYTYQERLSYRSDQTVQKTDDVYPFVLVPSATNTAVSTARLSIKKGLYVKLYCVANQKELYVLDDSKHLFNKAEFTPLKQTNPGTDKNSIETKGTPTEKDFQSKHMMHVINPLSQTDVIHTPLAMAGSIAGCIDLTDINENARLNVSMKLTRAVARFDIQNDKSKSKLEITSVGMSGGNATTSIFPYVGQPDANKKPITYPVRNFIPGTTEHTAINSETGLKSAYYTYAAPKDAMLVLNGIYTTPSGENVKVAYNVPFENITDGNGVKVNINPNHRYTVKVNQADAYQVKLTIKIADWEDGGNLDDYIPNNKIQINAPTSNTTDTQFSADYTWVGVDETNKNQKFIYNLESNSEMTHELVYFGVNIPSDQGWLTITESKQAISNGALWSYKYTYTFTVKAPTQPTSSSYPTATVVFKNKAGQVVNLVVQPRPKLNSYYANLVGDYWVAYSSQGNSQVALSAAKSACTGEWRIPTMNEWRKIVRSDKDWNHYLTPGTDAFYDFFEGATSTTINKVDKSVESLFNTSGTSAGTNINGNFWSLDTSKKTTGNNLCLKVDNYSSKQVSYTSVATTSSAYVRCIKDKQK